ncbi:hypothetical protein V8G54_010433 [Vigna mungo]|uniref:Uncharacterized protein n=1 Tax=Vigna mungo TaxID=3915 RepID=A0AAQ3NYH9_VIGMU
MVVGLVSLYRLDDIMLVLHCFAAKLIEVKIENEDEGHRLKKKQENQRKEESLTSGGQTGGEDTVVDAGRQTPDAGRFCGRRSTAGRVHRRAAKCDVGRWSAGLGPIFLMRSSPINSPRRAARPTFHSLERISYMLGLLFIFSRLLGEDRDSKPVISNRPFSPRDQVKGRPRKSFESHGKNDNGFYHFYYLIRFGTLAKLLTVLLRTMAPIGFIGYARLQRSGPSTFTLNIWWRCEVLDLGFPVVTICLSGFSSNLVLASCGFCFGLRIWKLLLAEDCGGIWWFCGCDAMKIVRDGLLGFVHVTNKNGVKAKGNQGDLMQNEVKNAVSRKSKHGNRLRVEETTVWRWRDQATFVVVRGGAAGVTVPVREAGGNVISRFRVSIWGLATLWEARLKHDLAFVGASGWRKGAIMEQKGCGDGATMARGGAMKASTDFWVVCARMRLVIFGDLGNHSLHALLLAHAPQGFAPPHHNIRESLCSSTGSKHNETGAIREFKDEERGYPLMYPVRPIVQTGTATPGCSTGLECLTWLEKQQDCSILANERSDADRLEFLPSGFLETTKEQTMLHVFVLKVPTEAEESEILTWFIRNRGEILSLFALIHNQGKKGNPNETAKFERKKRSLTLGPEVVETTKLGLD